MPEIRLSNERGVANFGWLNSHHTFSFGEYYNPRHMGFGTLRVINEDRVQPGKGFGTHGHQNMEIISYVLEGALEHKDSMGTGSVIRPGDVQLMSAGTGVSHSEFNHSNTELVHFLQIWILPNQNGLKPNYQQKKFPDEEKLGKLRLIASSDGHDGSVTINQDVNIYATLLGEKDELKHELKTNRNGWIHLIKGSITFNDQQMSGGDGVAIEGPSTITITCTSDAELLLFDMG